MILILGIPGGGLGVGVLVTTAGGLAIPGAGYTGLRRETSTLRATALVCAGAFVLNFALFMAAAN